MTDIKKITIAILASGVAAWAFAQDQSASSPYQDKSGYVRVSQKDPRYFEYDDGKPYIAVGLNYCFDRKTNNMAEIRVHYERDFAAMKENGANFARIMMQAWPTELEPSAGKYDEGKFEYIDWLIETARKNGIKLKLCMEAFRTKDGSRYAKSDMFKDMNEYLTSQKCRDMYLAKIDLLAKRYANCNTIFAIELWNEMNCVSAKHENVVAWTDYMCREIKKRFPNTLVVQSLGSFDRESLIPIYKDYMVLKSNDAAQVHRYLDLGAKLPVCQGPFVELGASAVREIRAMTGDTKPILLAETGAVKPRHTGPWEYYEVDKDGVIVHDLAFGVFFSGGAGTGHVWHWDQLLIDPNHWWHYGRFNEAIKKVNVLEEKFQPKLVSVDNVNCYALVGEKNTMIFCRDMNSDWKTEFVNATAPEPRAGVILDLSQFCPPEKIKNFKKLRFYDPWQNKWTKAEISGSKIRLPKFTRSIVVRLYE